jgi:transposase
MPYPSSLTDKEWEIIEPLLLEALPPKKQTRPSNWSKREDISTKPSKQEKLDQGKSGFVPAIARWVVERSNAWIERYKILTKNFERTLSNATAKINLCFIRLMAKRLAASS